MGALYLRFRPESCREALAKELQQTLNASGVHYHVRTIKRQLAGKVVTIPAAVQDAMRHLLLRVGGLQGTRDIDHALAAAGLAVGFERRVSGYVSTDRIVPLAQLWLLLNPTRSRRSLALELAARLSDTGCPLKADPIQVILAGRQTSARREVLMELLALLAPHGIVSEQEGRRRLSTYRAALSNYEAERSLRSASELFRLGVAWKVQAREPSSRHLAVLLRKRLASTHIDMSVHQLQEALDGKPKTVRGALVSAMESLLRETLREGESLEKAVAEATRDEARLIDLCWVDVAPIAELAGEWLEHNPGASMRQLALRVSRTARSMGYSTSISSVQPILGGHKSRTRGFVYRALLKQITSREQRVPREHVRPSRWAQEALAIASKRVPASGSKGVRSPRKKVSPTAQIDSVDAYLQDMRAHSVLSPEQERTLATRIVEAEHGLLATLLQSSAVVRDLASIE